MNVTVIATCGRIDWKSLEWGEVWSSLSIIITKAKGEGTNCDPILPLKKLYSSMSIETPIVIL